MCSRRLSFRRPERAPGRPPVVFLSAGLMLGLMIGLAPFRPGPASAQSRASEVSEVSEVETASGSAEEAELPRSNDGREGDSPGIQIGAGLASLLYTPTKVAYAGLGVVVGGLGWVFSGGDGQVAVDIMQPSFRGDYLIRPAHLRGEEPIHFVGRRPAPEQSIALEPEREPEPEPWLRSEADEAGAPWEHPEPESGSRSSATQEGSADDESIASDASEETADPRSTGGPILSKRDDPEDASESAARASGPSVQELPAVSAPPPPRQIGETEKKLGDTERKLGDTSKVGDARKVEPTSGTRSPDRPDAAEVEQARWDVRKDAPDRARDEAPRDRADGDQPDGEDAEGAWPEPQVDSMRWTKNAKGVWVYEAP